MYFAPFNSNMKNYKLLSTCLLLLPIYLFAQTSEYRSAENKEYWKNRKPYEGYWQQDVYYNIKASIDDSTDIISAEMELVYYNNSPDTLTQLYFHLYQNAFAKGAYLESLNRSNHYFQKFGKYESEGKGTEVESVEIISSGMVANNVLSEDGTRPVIDPVVSRYKATPIIDNSIMLINLEQPLLPGNAMTVKIIFKTYFDDGGDQRRRMKLYNAYGYKHYNGVHWYPRICVYDRKFGWETAQHLGKEFYGNFGTFEVELTLPKQYVLDATGVLTNTDEVLPADLRKKLDIKNFKDKPLEEKPSVIIEPDGTTKTWKFRAINVHDFAWTADPTYRIGETELKLKNGHTVLCIALAQEPHASRWQDASLFTSKVIETYSRDFGNYVYPKIIVADAADGMEYPMLTLDGGLSPGYYGLFAHEVGHNWFFGMVGNNETYRASLDEGFTQFLTNWAMTDIFGEVKPTTKNPFPTPRMDQTVYWGYLRDAMKWEDMPLNTHSDDFNSGLHHGGGYAHVYYKTATMLYNLQYVLGDELFKGAMQHYFDQWKMAHPYFEDFRNSITQYTQTDLNWFFDQWMETTKRIDYKVGRVKKVNGDSLEITFKRKGEMQMPIDFTVISKDGKRADYVIPNTWFVKETQATILPKWTGWGKLNPKYTATVKSPGKFANVMIDTSYRLADAYQVDNDWRQKPIQYLDKGKSLPTNRRKATLGYRPDIWYNSVDGVKAGIHYEGNYANTTDFISSTLWYNTELANDYRGSHDELLSLTMQTRKLLARKTYALVDLRFLDGLFYFKFGFEFAYKRSTIEIYFKSLERIQNTSLDYLLFPTEWNADKANNSINLVQRLPYQYRFGNGEIKHGLRASFLSDYDYSSYFIQVINEHRLGKFDLRTRLFGQVMQGSNIAPESRLFVAGANPEELMDNKFLRSRGFVPTDWLGYGNTVNHFQQGGGLNIRGYAGYLMPREVNGQQAFLYRGLSGTSVNAELDFDRLVNWKPGKMAKYFKLDMYLFGDAGILYNTFLAGEIGNTSNAYTNTGLLACAGAGTAFTIKKWGNMDKAKPLTIRFDMPFVLSNTPFVEDQFVKFRFVMGISRSF
jgi:aminopeptidase N